MNLGHAVLCQSEFAKDCYIFLLELFLSEARKEKNVLLYHFNSSNKMNLKLFSFSLFFFWLWQEMREIERDSSCDPYNNF